MTATAWKSDVFVDMNTGPTSQDQYIVESIHTYQDFLKAL